MAVSWTPFSDGGNLGTIRTAINTFCTAVKNNIDTIEISLGALLASKVAIADTGLMFSVGSALVPSQALSTSYAKVEMVDTTSVDVANTHVTMDYVNHTITVNTDGIYKLRFSGSMTVEANHVVEFNYNVNSTSLLTTPPQFIGRGTSSPVAIENSAVLQLTAGSTIYIEAKADSASNMTPIGCGLSIEKTHY